MKQITQAIILIICISIFVITLEVIIPSSDFNPEKDECNGKIHYYNVGCPVFGITVSIEVDKEDWHGGLCETKYATCG